MKILVFVDNLLLNFNEGKYVTVEGAGAKLQAWKNNGAFIVYLTSRIARRELEQIKYALKYGGFPKGPLSHLASNENYAHLAQRINPDIFVTDDQDLKRQLMNSGMGVVVTPKVKLLPDDTLALEKSV